METEPRLGGICTLSYPRLPPSARARGSRPQLQDRKRSGGEGGRGQEAREGPEGGGARRRGRSQRRGGPEGEGGARRVEHNTGIHTQCPRGHSFTAERGKPISRS